MVMGFIRRSDEAAASAFDCPARVLSCVRAHGAEHPVIRLQSSSAVCKWKKKKKKSGGGRGKN